MADSPDKKPQGWQNKLKPSERDRRVRAYHDTDSDPSAASLLGMKYHTFKQWRIREGLPAKTDTRTIPLDVHRQRLATYHSSPCDKDAAASLGIGRSTFKYWREKNGLPAKGTGHLALKRVVPGGKNTEAASMKNHRKTRSLLMVGQTGAEFHRVTCYLCDRTLEFSTPDSHSLTTTLRDMKWFTTESTQYCPNCIDDVIQVGQVGDSCKWLSMCIQERLKCRPPKECRDCGNSDFTTRGFVDTYYGKTKRFVCKTCRHTTLSCGTGFIQRPFFPCNDFALMWHVQEAMDSGWTSGMICYHLSRYHGINIGQASIFRYARKVGRLPEDLLEEARTRLNRVRLLLDSAKSKRRDREAQEIEDDMERLMREMDRQIRESDWYNERNKKRNAARGDNP